MAILDNTPGQIHNFEAKKSPNWSRKIILNFQTSIFLPTISWPRSRRSLELPIRTP